MIVHEVPLTTGTTTDQIATWLLRYVEHNGLTIRLQGTLRTIPGSTHWHLTRGPRSGTLELTYDPQLCLVIVAVHNNRRGTWAGEAVFDVITHLKAYFRRSGESNVVAAVANLS
jgi:hypothetical protein